MSKFAKVSLPLFSLCLFGIGVWLGIGSASRAQAPSATPRPALQFERINQKARVARDGDANAIDNLADEVFATIVGEHGVTAGDTAGLKARVVNAELTYRQGRRDGVKEIDVVRAVNGLARKLGAPSYAKTDQHEVRQLRVTMLLTEPDFVGQGHRSAPGQPKKRVGDTIEPELTPLEAVYTMADLVKQKLYNEEYQITRAERAARWAEEHHGKKAKEKHEAKVLDAPRYKEMQSVMRRAAEMSAGEALDTAHKTLDLLGIER